MKERARELGGILEIESLPHKGTTVRLSVPVSEESHNRKVSQVGDSKHFVEDNADEMSAAG
jgi:signal transduction histidine kinase